MENEIYSTNSNNAILKDFGPFKIQIGDQSLKGQKLYEYQQATKQIVVGKQMKIETTTIKTDFRKVDLYK